jgi:hypothetical protein
VCSVATCHRSGKLPLTAPIPNREITTVPIDVETTETMNDLQAHFECGGVEVERDDQYVHIKIKVHDGDNAIITRDQPITLTVFSHRVEAEYVQTYGKPEPEPAFNPDETFDAILAIDHTETVRVRLTYDLTRTPQA